MGSRVRDARLVKRLAIASGTLAIHGVLGVLLVLLDTPAPDEHHGSPVEITLVEPPASPAPKHSAASAGGGDERHVQPRLHHASPRAESQYVRDGLSMTIESDRGSSESSGGGTGGDGFGPGRGRLAELLPPPPAPVPPPPAAPGPPPVSKARPARLIYPSRQVQIADDLLFVAMLTIDREGFVAGAHLTRGFGGPRDDQAASLVWRFRYAPALDDAGRPIQSTLEQRFDVGR